MPKWVLANGGLVVELVPKETTPPEVVLVVKIDEEPVGELVVASGNGVFFRPAISVEEAGEVRLAIITGKFALPQGCLQDIKERMILS